MNRSSLKYLVIGLLVGGLATSTIDASAIVSRGDTQTAGSAAVTKKRLTKKQQAAKRKAAAAKKKKARKKKPVAPATATTTATPLVGLFRFTPGAYSNSTATGSYIRLVLAGGNVDNGPFFPNPSSKATTYTLLNPGTDGGLRTGVYQPAPSPPFSGAGDALADRIIAPQRFALINYSAQTSPKAPQSGADVPAPSITVTPDGRLAGNLSAFAAQWNKQSFDVGSPKPDGTHPGLTSPVTGTYNSDTHAFTLDWTSQIVGGAFNNFSAKWHFEGTFEAGCAA